MRDGTLAFARRSCEYEFMFIFNRRLLILGAAVWLAATLILRAAGQAVLHPDWTLGTLSLFAVSFPLMAWVARRACRSERLPPDQWPAGAVSLLLPTLLLDPFSSAFFPVVFPNIPAAAAGVFGGWMLWCCAGAFVGVTMRAHARP